MTREEAIEILENGGWWDLLIPVTTIEGRDEEDKLHEAIDLAIAALRPVSQALVEKLPRCEHCKDGKSFDGQVIIMGNKGILFPLNFCPLCGSPLTDEAVEMVMERLEG